MKASRELLAASLFWLGSQNESTRPRQRDWLFLVTYALLRDLNQDTIWRAARHSSAQLHAAQRLGNDVSAFHLDGIPLIELVLGFLHNFRGFGGKRKLGVVINNCRLRSLRKWFAGNLCSRCWSTLISTGIPYIQPRGTQVFPHMTHFSYWSFCGENLNEILG